MLVVTAILVKILENASTPVIVISHLAANLVVALATVQILRRYARLERKRVTEARPVAMAPQPEMTEVVIQE
jgi:hypothetical protein